MVTVTPAAATASKEDIGQLIADFAKGAIAKLELIPTALTGAGASVTNASALATNAAGSVSNAIDAATEIGAIVVHIESGQWLAVGGDVEKLLTDILAILSKFGINYAPLTMVATLLAKTFG